MEWINKIHQGNTLEVLKQMPDDFVDMIITSPPYWGLRDYGKETETIWGGDKECDHDFTLTKDKFSVNVGDKKNSYDRTSLAEGVEQGFCKKCGAWKGQLGLEPHPNMFIDNLVEIFREVKRVMKPTGSFYLNMGDSYFGGNMCVGQPKDWKSLSTSNREKYDSDEMEKFIKKRNKLRSNWLQPKQLMLIPSRVAVAMQEDGWCLRNDIIWHKPNPMPSSVKDRLNNTYEHVFHFVKKKKYHYDLDAIRVPHKVDSIKRACRGRQSSKLDSEQYAIHYKEDYRGYENMEDDFKEGKLRAVNPKGKNPGDVAILKSWGSDKNFEYHGDGKHNPKGQSPSDLKRNIIESFKDNPKGKNPGDVIKTKREKLLETGMVRHGGEGSTLGDPDRWNPLGKNPGDTVKIPYSVQPRNKDVIEYRDLPDIKEFSSWLNAWRKERELTIADIEDELDSQAPHHWFNGESFPTVDNWKAFKATYNPPDKYDEGLLNVKFKPADKVNHPIGKNPGDFWNICTQPFSDAHFAVFPEELISGPIKSSCPKEGIVMDIFAGSGTACLVAKRMGRNYIGLELNPEYVKMARERLSKLDTIDTWTKTETTTSVDDLDEWL